jgi:DNA-binding response OmpR family regulator
MERRTSGSSGALEGEDLSTTHSADARHWISIYADLLEFKRNLLDRVHKELPKLRPEAQAAAQVDVSLIEMQMNGYEARLELWYRRVWELQGLWIDPETHAISYRGREAPLTKREFELMQLMLEHPHRYFSTRQIVSAAWADSRLSPEEARNYVKRLRKVLVDLGAPVDLVNRPGRGYSLVFRPD